MKKKILFFVGVLCFFYSGKSQQLTQPSQLRSVFDINPATIGINENIALTTRQVFSAIEGAPSLQCISINKLIDQNMGVGLNVYSTSQGFVEQKGIKAAYMYRVQFNESSFLSFGITADLFQNKYNTEDFDLKDPADPVFAEQVVEQSGVDFDAGLSYNTPLLYVDIAVHQIPGRSVSFQNDLSDNKRVRHYFLQAGYKFYFPHDLILEPGILFKTIETFAFHADAGAKCIWNNKVWLGLYYRTTGIVVGSTGFKMDRFSFGFGYDYGFQDIFNYSTGSWEFQFIYDLHQSKSKLNSL